jgi:hypothetical protein
LEITLVDLTISSAKVIKLVVSRVDAGDDVDRNSQQRAGNDD